MNRLLSRRPRLASFCEAAGLYRNVKNQNVAFGGRLGDGLSPPRPCCRADDSSAQQTLQTHNRRPNIVLSMSLERHIKAALTLYQNEIDIKMLAPGKMAPDTYIVLFSVRLGIIEQFKTH